MKKLISLLILIFAFSAVLVMTVNASMVPKLTTPSVTAYLDNGFYVGYCYNSTITAGETFDIEWKNDSSVTGYQVIVKSLDSDPNPGDSEPGTKLAEYNKSSGDNSVTLSSKITQNAAGKWLKVFVAYNYSDGYSSSASFYFIVSAVVDLETPELTVENIDSSNSLKLTWTKVSGATGYDIYRSTSSVASSFKTPIKSIASGSTTSWVDTGLEADTRYYYKIKAISGRYESDFSNRDYARTDEETVDFARNKSPLLRQAEARSLLLHIVEVIHMMFYMVGFQALHPSMIINGSAYQNQEAS